MHLRGPVGPVRPRPGDWKYESTRLMIGLAGHHRNRIFLELSCYRELKSARLVVPLQTADCRGSAASTSGSARRCLKPQADFLAGRRTGGRNVQPNRGLYQPSLDHAGCGERANPGLETCSGGGGRCGLPATIPEGMRALSVAVNDVVGVAGFVIPGTMVDVLVTGQIGEGRGSGSKNVTRTILENVRVLAAGQKVEQDREGKPQTVPVITLLVSPEDAAKLTMASTEGKIQLSLRNTVDTKKT